MTALCRVTVCAEADDGVGRATASPSPNTPPLLRAQPRHSRSAPSAPNFVIPRAVAESMTPAPNPAIPEVPPAPQLRHSARSRGIHDPCPQPRHSRSTPSAPTSSFRAQSRNPSPASQRISQRSQCPLHSTMDTATSRSMTALVFRGQSRNPSPASQRISQRSQRPLHSTMDTATSRSMTALCRVTVCAEADDGVGRATASPSPNTPPLLRAHPVIPEVPPAPQLRHSARSRGIHDPCPQPRHSRSSSQRPNFVIPRAVAESMTPAPHPAIPEVPPASQLRHSAHSRGIHLPRANASAREASALCTPPWILRLRAV